MLSPIKQIKLIVSFVTLFVAISLHGEQRNLPTIPFFKPAKKLNPSLRPEFLTSDSIIISQSQKVPLIKKSKVLKKTSLNASPNFIHLSFLLFLFVSLFLMLLILQKQNRRKIEFLEEKENKLLARLASLKESNINLKKFIDYEKSIHNSIVEQKKLDIQVNIKEDIYIKTEVEIFELIFKNLFVNAINYSQNGGKILISYATINDTHQISIKDFRKNEEQERMVLMFEKNKRREIEAPSMDLAFSLYQHHINKINGTINFQSMLEQGCEFTIELPIKEVVNKESEKAFIPITNNIPSKESNVLVKNKSTESILILEDDLAYCKILNIWLGKDYDLHFFHRANEALVYLEKETPSLIITDWMLPEMNGLNFIKHLKKNLEVNLVPIIMLTARNLVTDQLRAKKAGVDIFLTKTVSESVLVINAKKLIAEKPKNKIHGLLEIDELDNKGITISVTDQLWLLDLEELILTNLSQTDLEIKTIALQLNITGQQLSRKIKRITGFTASKYIQEIKFWEARRMLETGAYGTVKEVSFSIGYRDQKYFAKKFKERFEKSPSEFINN